MGGWTIFMIVLGGGAAPVVRPALYHPTLHGPDSRYRDLHGPDSSYVDLAGVDDTYRDLYGE